MTLHPEIRSYRSATDEALIHQSWKESYWSRGERKWAKKADYYAEMNRRVDELVNSASVLVATNPRDADHIWAWICHSDGTAHYIWVRSEYRRRGLATGLLNLALGDRKTTPCSYWTDVCETVQDRLNLRYVPSKGRPHAVS